jgi:hypothetical protein
MTGLSHEPFPTAPLGSLSAAWGAYLHKFYWDHFATLTFEYPSSADAAIRELHQHWIRRVSRNAQHPIPCAYALERGAGGLLHFHVLTAGTASLTVEQLRQAWRSGISRIEVYDPERGAAWYISKGVLGRCEWYDVTRRRPPLFRNAE